MRSLGGTWDEQGLLLQRPEVRHGPGPGRLPRVIPLPAAHSILFRLFSAIRFATLVSQYNTELHRAMSSFGLFIKPSSVSDALLYALLTAPPPTGDVDQDGHTGSFECYADWFIHTNQRRMREAYRYMRDRLEKAGLEVVPSYAGHFIWTKVSKVAGWGSWESELDGFGKIFDAGVYIVSSIFTSPSARRDL